MSSMRHTSWPPSDEFLAWRPPPGPPNDSLPLSVLAVRAKISRAGSPSRMTPSPTTTGIWRFRSTRSTIWKPMPGDPVRTIRIPAPRWRSSVSSWSGVASSCCEHTRSKPQRRSMAYVSLQVHVHTDPACARTASRGAAGQREIGPRTLCGALTASRPTPMYGRPSCPTRLPAAHPPTHTTAARCRP